MWNRHRKSEIHDIHEIFIHLFEFKGFSTWGERDTIWLLLHCQLSTQPTRGARSAQRRLALAGPESQPSSSQVRTQLTFPNLKVLSPHFRAWRHSYPLVTFSIWGFILTSLNDTSSPRAWTPALMLHLTNPCTKRKVLILTKLKGKIYKMKSPHHYITCIQL